MAGTALVQADVVALTKSWVVRIWLLVLVMSFLVFPVAMVAGNGAGSAPASGVLAAYLAVFLNVWSIVIIVLSAGSVSLEAGIVADSILSRACTRTQYILAKLASRALVIGGVYLVGASAAAYVAWRYGAVDVTLGTMVSGIAIVGLALLMLVSLGVTMSAIFNNTIVSVIGLLLLWHVAGTLFAFAGAEYMSPASLSGRLPEILRDSRAPQVVSCSATKTSVSIIFSKDIDPISAEQIDNYTVEDPEGTRHVPQTAVYDPAAATVRLNGLSPEVSEAITVTVDGVTDSAGNEVSPAANEATSRPPPAESEDDAEADPADEESPDPKPAEEAVTPTRGPAAAKPPRSSRNRPVEGVGGGAGIVVSFAANEQTWAPAPLESQDDGEADPVDEPSPPPPEAPKPDAEGVTPTPESAGTDSPGPSDSPTVEGVADGEATPDRIPPEPGDDEETHPNEQTPPPSPEGGTVPAGAGEGVAPTPGPAPAVPAPGGAAAMPMPPAPGALGAATPPPPMVIPGPNPGGAGVPPTPEAASAQPDGSSPNQGDRPPRVTQVKATRATVSVTFSQDMDPVEAEELENYTVESPPGTTRLPTTGAYDPAGKTVLLSGLSFAPGDPVKVTVENITGSNGAKIDPRNNSGTFSEVQTWKYLLGFGVPALLFALVGGVWFSRRDL